MTNDLIRGRAHSRLRATLANARVSDSALGPMLASKDEVLGRYQRLFSLDRINVLDPGEFKSFLYLENNRHWTGLNRKGWRAVEDLPKLKACLTDLLTEDRPIAERVTRAIAGIRGMGKALTTAILTVVYPDRYGVWNNTSEGGLRLLGLWPEFPRGAPVGVRYEIMNGVLVGLASDLGIDLWTLDALWWGLQEKDSGSSGVTAESLGTHPTAESVSSDLEGARFSLEKHLEDFLVSNWDRTLLGREWAIYSNDEEEDVGQQFPTDVGRIDILAKHRSEPRWLVIELKRGQSSDQTVGQILRYMGWVREHLSKIGEAVEGLIVAHQSDVAMKYALKMLTDVGLMHYEVRFELLRQDVGHAQGPE